MPTTKKRGRPPKKPDVQQKVVEVLREVIVEIEKPQLDGYDLYLKLRDTGYFQGGSGQYVEDPNGIDRVYVPTAQEVITFFTGDPEKWDLMRDGIVRAYLDIYEEME